MIDSLLVAAVFTILASPLCAFPSGAPTSACKTLEPDHTSPTTCGRNCPFKLSLIAIDNRTVPNPTTYRCGAVHKLRLQTNGAAIKGFTVQGRQATAEFDDRAPYVGSFVNGGIDWKLWACSAPSATHRSKEDKTSIDLLWKAPDTPSSQNIVFCPAVLSIDGPHCRTSCLRACSAACSNANINAAVSTPSPRRSPLSCNSVLRGLTLLVNCSSPVSSAACRINGEPPSLCTFPFSKDVSHLSLGNHTFVISTPDISVPTTFRFKIEATLSLSCRGTTDDFSLTVNCNSSVPLRTIVCAVDNSPPRPCVLPFKRPINPTSPPRSVSVFVTGMNGVGATSVISLVRLSLRCESQMDRGISVTVNCSSSSPLATAQCALDDEPASPCTIPYTRDTSELTPGLHRILVTATTASGSSASTATSFNVPVPGTITLNCEGDVTNSVLTVTCESPNEITNLVCSLDQVEAQPCGPLPYVTDVSALSPGQHTFAATITGPNGVTASSLVHFTTSASMPNVTFNDACTSSLLSANSVVSSCEEGCPYTLALVQINGRAVANVLRYHCGASYTIKLSSNEGRPFTAFAVQARTSSEFFDVDAPFVGQFVGASGSSDVRNCGIQGSAIQSSDIATNAVQLTWQAPKLMPSAVTFWYSVKTADKLFIQLRGPSLGPDPRSCSAHSEN